MPQPIPTPIFIAIKRERGETTRMQMYVEVPLSMMDPKVAKENGFKIKGGRYVRNPTDAQIQAEVDRAIETDGYGRAVSWERRDAF